MPLTVTATQTGVTVPGMLLRVDVLTGCAAAQDGGSAVFQSGLNPPHTAVATTVAGSVVYGALVRDTSHGSAGPFTPAAGNTLDDNAEDAAYARFYATGRTLASGVPGPVAVGASGPGRLGKCGCAFAEILPAGTIIRDASSPPPAFAPAATGASTDAFDPPPGALIVARVCSNGSGTDPQFVAVGGGGLAWMPLVEQHGTGFLYSGVWAAQS